MFVGDSEKEQASVCGLASNNEEINVNMMLILLTNQAFDFLNIFYVLKFGCSFLLLFFGFFAFLRFFIFKTIFFFHFFQFFLFFFVYDTFPTL